MVLHLLQRPHHHIVLGEECHFVLLLSPFINALIRDSSVRADLAPSTNGQSAAPSGANTPADKDVRMGSPPPTVKPDSPTAAT